MAYPDSRMVEYQCAVLLRDALKAVGIAKVNNQHDKALVCAEKMVPVLNHMVAALKQTLDKESSLPDNVVKFQPKTVQ